MWESLAAHGLHKTVRKIQGSKLQVTGGMTCVTCSFLKRSLVPGHIAIAQRGVPGGGWATCLTPEHSTDVDVEAALQGDYPDC